MQQSSLHQAQRTAARPHARPTLALSAALQVFDTSTSSKFLDPLGRRDHVGETDPELVVHNDHFAVRDQRALVELQQVADRDARAADFHRQRHGHIEDHFEIDIARASVTATILQVVELGFRGLFVLVTHREISVAWDQGLRVNITTSGALILLRATRSSICTACWPCDTPNVPRKTGTSSAITVARPLKSQGRTSPGCSDISCCIVILPRPSTVLSSISASSISSRSAWPQRSSCSARSLATPACNCSRSGSIIEYGIVTWMSPPPPSSSMRKQETTTTSDGLTTFAKCGLTSELMYSMSRRATCDQASCRSPNTYLSTMWMMRCSVAVNSRPSILAKRPTPPKKLSTAANTSFGSRTISPVPRSGRNFTILRFVGTASECT